MSSYFPLYFSCLAAGQWTVAVGDQGGPQGKLGGCCAQTGIVPIDE